MATASPSIEEMLQLETGTSYVWGVWMHIFEKDPLPEADHSLENDSKPARKMWRIAVSTSRRLVQRGQVSSPFPTSNPLMKQQLQSRTSLLVKARAPITRQQQHMATSRLENATATVKESVKENPVVWWLIGCAGLVASTMTVGAAAPFTRAGASMLYWMPSEAQTPRSEQEWHHMLHKYRRVSEHSQRKHLMTLDEFKHAFQFENVHRMLGEVTALSFLGPFVYFFAKDKLPPAVQIHVIGALVLGTLQVFCGHRLSHADENSRTDRNDSLMPSDTLQSTAPFGLTIDTAFSLSNVSLLLWAGMTMMSPASRTAQLREMVMATAMKDVATMRQAVQYATAVFLGTATAGTLMASIDAGKHFNTFPTMDGRLIPHGLFEKQPWLRNVYDNVALVQLDHRLLAIGTLTAYAMVYSKAKRPQVWDHLPPETKRAMKWMLLTVAGQAVGGVATVVNAAPSSLAMIHESGAIALLGTSLWTLHTLRFSRPAGALETARAAAKVL